MLRLAPTEIQITAAEVEMTRRNVDLRRATASMRARAFMHRTFTNAGRGTVIMKARRGPQRSRDQAVVHQPSRDHYALSASTSETDELALDHSDHDVIAYRTLPFGLAYEEGLPLRARQTYHQEFSDASGETDLDQSCDDLGGVNESFLFDPYLGLDGADPLSAVRAGFTPTSHEETGSKQKQVQPTDSGHGSPVISVNRPRTRVPSFNLPFRPRVRERSSSDPLTTIVQAQSDEEDLSVKISSRCTSSGGRLPSDSSRHAFQSNTETSQVAQDDRGVGSDTIHQQESIRAPPPSAILAAVGGLISPLETFYSGTAMEDWGEAEQERSSTPQAAAVPGGARSPSREAIAQSLLSRQNAVRLTPARRRQHARTAYTERHLQPNYAALRAARPNSEGSPFMVRRMPPNNQENMDEEERLIEARRVWLARGRTGGILDDTPPREGRRHKGGNKETHLETMRGCAGGACNVCNGARALTNEIITSNIPPIAASVAMTFGHQLADFACSLACMLIRPLILPGTPQPAAQESDVPADYASDASPHPTNTDRFHLSSILSDNMRSNLLIGLAGLYVATNAISTISTKGSKFFTDDGKQWFIKDPLLDTDQCKMDAELMQSLGANAIRVYHVDPTGDHSGCMSAFSDAGIYLFVDLDDFKTQITEDNARWTEPQETEFQGIMDEFQKYDNTAGFFIGNEVLTNGNHTEVAVLVKASTRDLKTYRDSKGYRQIPIGYSHADIAELRPNLQNYLACGSNRNESVDFFGLNAYEWCGENNFRSSGYETLTNQIKDYPVPIFFSETGCITQRQNNGAARTFQDQAAIFGPDMAPYWSGAIVYEWIQEANAYGLITYGGDTDATVTPKESEVIRSGTPTPITPDFANLKSAWATASASGVSESAYNPTLTPPPCPTATPGTWLVNGDVSLPTVGVSLDQAASASITQGTSSHRIFLGASSTFASVPYLLFSSISAIALSEPASNSRLPGSGAAATTTPTSPASSTAAAILNKEVSGAGFGLMGVLLGLVWL
ncbi:hypothetical protein FH972_023538 [Carpinus fangiana]|uniref:1,3-beta-glucanosyltransferase n=1 Tax=Carpinus fangiana TaxID=176857 RepID=A0A5N6KVV0_9ROSI|nr:hypothetical protein FH972_023538 [Carpinus fangiana]